MTPKPIFFMAYPTSETHQTGEAIAENLEKAIIEIGLTKISAIVMDNAFIMKKACYILELKYSNIIFLGCIAHSLNLLIGSIMKISWNANILKNVYAIVSYFCSHQISAAILKYHQLVTYQ